MNIILTGTNGLIGNILLNKLLIKYPNANFIILNRSKSKIFKKNIIELNFDITKITNEEINQIFNIYKPEIFFHLAWITEHNSYLNSNENLIWLEKSKFMITNFYKNNGIFFIGLGTSLEYNWDSKMPLEENVSELKCQNFKYGKAKLELFNFLESNFQSNRYLWCRIFFVFGPNQDQSRLIPKMIESLVLNKNILEFNIELQRDYISTFEIANQIIMMMDSNYKGPINICSGKPFKLKFIYNSICDILKTNSLLTSQRFQDNFDIDSVYGSKKLFNQYFPNYEYNENSLYSDLNKTVNFYKNKLN